MAAPLPATKIVLDRVRTLRKQRGMTTYDLAQGMCAAGYETTRALIASAETGRRKEISVDWLLAAAKSLDIEPHVLLAQPACAQCRDVPPPGFTCTACGATTKTED